MPFKQGTSGNPNGRPKGSGYSIKLRMQITNFCEENLDYFLNEIKQMKTGHAKSQAFLSLLNFALPKLTENNSFIDPNQLNDEQIDKLLTTLLNDKES